MANEAKKAGLGGAQRRGSVATDAGPVARAARLIEAKRAAKGAQAGGDESMNAPTDSAQSRARGKADESSTAVMRAAKRLAQLRDWRGRKGRDVTLTETISASARSLKRSRTAMGGLIDAWRAVIPAALEARTRVKSVRGGVATVEAQSASVAFELTRMLRGGVETELRRHYSGTLARVVVRVANGWES